MRKTIKNTVILILLLLIIFIIIQLNTEINNPIDIIFMVILIFIMFIIMYTITIVYPNNFEHTLEKPEINKSFYSRLKLRSITIIQKIVSRTNGNGPSGGPL